ncbi:sensor histidine kinase [Adhaeribacter soli]|uniref:sensor histidine kinase n=1 Tax=Adhaeribacter soli TaxID=2607655 RepID=UPI00177C1FC5|nr:sensor histidine kinase [Adhaeribacter soli]
MLPLLVSGQQLQLNTRTFEYQNELLKVKKLYQDQDGFIWLGTAQGLFRFDGLKPEPYRLASKKPLPSVSALFQDKQKQLWIGCDNGKIYRLVNNQLQAFSPEEGTPKEAILDIEEDAKGNIWFATYGEGIYVWIKNRLYNLNTDDGLPDDYIYSLARDAYGQIWAGTDRGIAVCNFSTDKKAIRKIGAAQGLSDNIVTALAPCPARKTIWAGTYSGGFCRIDAATLKISNFPASQNWQEGGVKALLPTGSSCIIGTHGRGLWKFDPTEPERLISLNNDAASTSLRITDLITDAEGTMWVAGNAPEVLTAFPNLRFLETAKGVKPTGVQAVLTGRNGNIWFSTEEGLFCARKQLQGLKVEPAFMEQPFRKFKIISLYEDVHGLLWIGTFGGGLFLADPVSKKVRQFTEKDGLINDNVLSIAGTKEEVWLATLGGASRCRIQPENKALNTPLNFENFNQRDGIGFNYIYQVFIDSKKQVWFATDGKGLIKLQNGRFTRFTEKNGLISRTVYSVAETKDGSLWVSAPKAGIFKFNGTVFKNFGLKEGLRDPDISSLATDKFGNLLILHKKGMDVLEPATGRISYLGEERGLKMKDPNLNTVSRDAAGPVWFGAEKGLAAYQPEKAELPVSPQMRLTSVQLFLKPLGQNAQPLAYDENHITFEYAGLWYQAPADVSYRLKLEGYDREWILSNNRSITYPKLPPGKYTFKVSASATGNFSNAPVQTYTFTIEKPFWNTMWFYLASLAGAGSLLFGFIKSREKRLKKAERLEKDKVMFQFETLKNQVNPHFLFNSFNTLIGIIEDDQEAAVEYVEKLSDFFRDILVYREKDTITVREELVLIQNYYFLQQKRYGSNLKLEVKVPDSVQELRIAPLTLQLLVENAIKHNVVSRSKPLMVEIGAEAENYLAVRNNLQPKKQAERSTGIGLANIRNRYAILGKRPVVINQNDILFEVKVPLFYPE